MKPDRQATNRGEKQNPFLRTRVRRPDGRRPPSALITGGAGFIGTNLAARLVSDGYQVTVFDNLSREGVRQNLGWLRAECGDALHFAQGDIRDESAVQKAVAEAAVVFHLAAQVAVTTSLDDPGFDFAVNAGGTLNVLEACRRRFDPPVLLFTSTNKVYGDLDDLELQLTDQGYVPQDQGVRNRGIGESRPLRFHSPYGCSKGTADQYVLDYARCWKLPNVVFRMSCIYGPHQCGNEDQGWVAHFLRRILERQPITIYGDGHQVRDILFVEDLVQAMLLATAEIDDVRGRAFNMGGGPTSAVSLLETIRQIERLERCQARIGYGPQRRGDQRYYVSDASAFQSAVEWSPRVSPSKGITRLHRWMKQANSLVAVS